MTTLSEVGSSRFLRFSIIVSSLCLAIVLRLANFSYFTADFTGHFNFIDTDCYYQLRRLVYFLVHFPSTLTFDPLADWPSGSPVDWPDGFTFILGLPLRILGIDTFKGLEISSCIIMILLGLITILCIYQLAKRTLNHSSLTLMVLFLACTNLMLVRFSCLGEVDHHILEAMFPSIVILLSLKAFVERRIQAAFLLGFIFTLFLWVSSSSLFMIGVFFALYGLVLGKPGDGKYFAALGLGFSLSIVPLAVYHFRSLGSWKLLTHPSIFHLALVSVLAGLAFWIPRNSKNSNKILFTFFVLGGALYWLQFPSIIMEPLQWAIGYVFGHSGALQNVSEAAPIFMNFSEINLNFMHANFGYLIYLLPLVWVLAFFSRRLSQEERVLILSLAMLSIPAVFQKRFCHIMIGLFFIYVVWCLKKTLEFLKNHKFRIGPMFLLMFVCFTILPGLKFGFYPESSVRDRIDHSIAQLFLAKVPIKTSEAWDRLALLSPPSGGIYSNPNLGHLMNYITGYGVLTNSFYHAGGFERDFKIRNTQTDEEFRKMLTEYKLRYLILVDDFKFLELQYRLRDLSSEFFMSQQVVGGETSTIFKMDELMRFAWVRWLLAEGDIDHFTQVTRATFYENYFYRNMIVYRFDDL